MNWISVKDRLPEPKKWVLIYIQGGYFYGGNMAWQTGYYDGVDWCRIYSPLADSEPVTHWVELPEAPPWDKGFIRCKNENNLCRYRVLADTGHECGLKKENDANVSTLG